MSTKKLIKALGLIIVVALLAAALPLQAKAEGQPGEVWVDDDFMSETPGWGVTHFASIQNGINAVAPGGTINVAAGTYEENPTTTNKPLNFVGIPDADGELPVIQGKLTIDSTGYTSADNITIDSLSFLAAGDYDSIVLKKVDGVTIKNSTFDGNDQFMSFDAGGRAVQMDSAPNDHVTIDNCSFKDGYYVTIQGYVNNLTVNDSSFTNVKSGINVWGPAGNTVTIDNTDFSVIAQGETNDTYGVRFASSGANTGGDLTITNSRFVVDKNDKVAEPGTYHSAIIIRAGATGDLKVENSSILGEVVNLTASKTLVATNNWWGSVAGPGASQINGAVDFTPWCGDAACSFLVSATEPAVSGFYVKDGKLILKGAISGTGGIVINEPLYILLKTGTVIQNSSPCFIINSSNVHIDSETLGGAKCVPTNGANGIDVAADLNNITIEGIEFDGTGQTTGDGIHFAGAVKDIVLVDNYMHDLDGDGIKFAGNVAEIVNIQGNMFKNNAGYGINNLGATTVGAEYNSWGDVAGPAAGDGVNGPVTSTPFTHADLYLVSSGTPWANQVVKGQQITYTVKAHLVNVNAADFVLTYPAELTLVSSTASGTFGTASVTHNASAHTLHFIGFNTANVTGDLPLFSVTFSGATAGANLPLSFSYTTTSGFGMAGYESSTNVYVNAMVNGAVTIIDLPTISSTDIQGYYLTGEQREFHVTATNPSTGGSYAHVIFQFNVTADAGDLSLEYYEGSTWHALPLTCASGVCSGYYGPSTGFPMPNPYSATSLFRVTAAVPGSYPVEIKLLDLDTDPDAVLATYTNTAVVYDKPSVTSTDIQGYYLSGEQREFSVVLTNPILGGNFAHVYVNYTIAHADMDEIQTIEYSVDHTTWVTLGAAGSGTSYGEDGYGNIVGFFGQIAGGGFPMVPNSTQTTWFRITFKTREQSPTNYPTSYDISMKLMDADFTPADRQLRDFSKTANVYDKPSLTSTDIAGPYPAGMPQDFHVTVNNPATGGNFVNSIYYVFTITGAEKADIYSLTCNFLVPAVDILALMDDSTTDLVGRVGVSSGVGFTMPSGIGNLTTTCNVKFKSVRDYEFTVDMVDNPGSDPANDRILVSMSQTATVNSDFPITGTFSMQGRVFRGGIPVTLTWTEVGWTYSASDDTEDLLVNNFQVTVTYGGGYLITTNQPRYLNIGNYDVEDQDVTKSVTVDGAKTLSSLWLRGGNAVWTDNVIDVNDASKVGTDWGSTDNPDGNVNFDSIVNIQDLALVGGNYNLTSATAYASWTP